MRTFYNSLLQNKALQYFVEVLFMTAIILIYCFRPNIAYNEMDIIPYAKSVYNPSWLQTDWYLSLKIPYRYLFSYAVGFFTEQFGVVNTIFFGRLLTYIFFAVAFLQLLKPVNLNRALRILILILYLQLFQYGIGDAGEWMVGGLDTKVFAYCFALLSLTSFAQKKYRWGLLFSGFSLSFHLLVGGYNLICLVPVILIEQRNTKGYILDLLKSSYLFLISGAVGIFALFSQFTSQVDQLISAEAWNIYVNIRVPHHVIPNFSAKSTIVIILFTVINILFLKSKTKYHKSLALYSLASVFILLVGLIIFYFLDHQYLKYYFFRTSNVILPLITLVLVIFFFYERFGKLILANRKPQLILGILIVGLLGLQFESIGAIINLDNYDSETVLDKTSEDVELMHWIQQNTDKNAVFLIPPYMEYFYLNAERAVFVTWKNSPQGAVDILEWHKRLKLINGNQNFNDLAEINKAYVGLNENSIRQICQQYPEIDFVILMSKISLNAPSLFKTEKHVIYRISDL